MRVFCAPVPTMVLMPASTRALTPVMRSWSVSSGQSPMDPQ